MRAVRRALEQTSMQWGVVVTDIGSDAVLFEHDGDRVLNSASLGKLVVLGFVGNTLLDDPSAGNLRLDRRAAAPVSDSGVWQHLDINVLSVADAARLVFIASDNLATNALLHHFGLETVRRFRASLGLRHTDLLDIVRDTRGPGEPETLSRAPARELCHFMARLARGGVVGPALSHWLRAGLSLNVDLSMVPAPLGLDPLAHSGGDGGAPPVANKTGADPGARADAGIIRIGSRELAYAAICNYEPAAVEDAEVQRVMHMIGEAIC